MQAESRMILPRDERMTSVTKDLAGWFVKAGQDSLLQTS